MRLMHLGRTRLEMLCHDIALSDAKPESAAYSISSRLTRSSPQRELLREYPARKEQIAELQQIYADKVESSPYSR
ncbi:MULTISPECIES: hypothetical protein [Ensifer]|uniref:hypothetical protein n=1 Tax=Ensifer TaxID=106591 RepID=UPI00041575E4|nr:hypothetical protein [Ensifer sp. SL37]MCY1746215.1 hypothetical protein [Ensifer sp. SL37]